MIRAGARVRFVLTRIPRPRICRRDGCGRPDRAGGHNRSSLRHCAQFLTSSLGTGENKGASFLEFTIKRGDVWPATGKDAIEEFAALLSAGHQITISQTALSLRGSGSLPGRAPLFDLSWLAARQKMQPTRGRRERRNRFRGGKRQNRRPRSLSPSNGSDGKVAVHRRLVPLTTLLTFRLPTARRRAACSNPAPYRAAISTGSGSARWRQSLHHTISVRLASAVLTSVAGGPGWYFYLSASPVSAL
jgi:hypothetical protein